MPVKIDFIISNSFVSFFSKIFSLFFKQVEKILKHKDLENQLANAKFQQSELKLAELSERHKSEKTIVKKKHKISLIFTFCINFFKYFFYVFLV